MTTLYLNSAKVIRHFGIRPHLGKRMRLKTRRLTKGNLPYKQMFGKTVPDHFYTQEVMVALKPKGKDMFEVQCEPEYREEIELWLVDNCR